MSKDFILAIPDKRQLIYIGVLFFIVLAEMTIPGNITF